MITKPTPSEQNQLIHMERDLKVKLGERNVEIELFTNNFCIVVRNQFGYSSHFYSYEELHTIDVIKDVLTCYIVR